MAAFVLLLLLLFSILLNFGALLGSLLSGSSSNRASGGPRMQEVVLVDTPARSKVVVIDIGGLIMGGYLSGGGFTYVDLVKAQLDLAAEDDYVEAVILRVNSPGGEVLASDEISRAITKFQEESQKPVVAAFGGLAASGAYYVAAPARWIVANELTLTGSIGVIMRGYNYRGLMDKVGIRPEVFKSGKFKDMLRSDKADDEILPEEREMVQDIIGQAFSRFREVIEAGRREAAKRNGDEGRALAENWRDFTDGRILTGKQAYEHGFVDELGNFDTAVERANTLVQLSESDLVQYRIPFELTSLFRLLGQTENRSVTVDWGMDLPRIEAGRLYFLFVPGL